MKKLFGLLLLSFLLAACGGESAKVCTTHLDVRLSVPDPLDGADRALIQIETRGAPLLREVDLSETGSGIQIQIPDTKDVPPSDSFRLAFAAASSSDTITAIGRTTEFGCLGEANQQVPLYIGPAGGFAPVATSTQSVDRASGSVLPDGQALIFGGYDGGAFLYDHSLGTVCAPGSSGCRLSPAPPPRVHHSATELADGRVLIVGGQNPANGELETEATLYDPATGSFSRLADLDQRYKHAAVLLGGVNTASDFSGKVLVVGGLDESDAALDSADLIDVTTGSVTPFTMNSPRSEASATMLGSGEVLVAGGRDASAAPLDSVDLFDSKDGGSGTFGLAGGTCPGTGANLCAKRAGHTATVIHDHDVLLWGGEVLTATGASGSPPPFEVFRVLDLNSLPALAAQGSSDAWDGQTVTAISCGTSPCPVLIVGGGGPDGLFHPAGKSGDQYLGSFVAFGQNSPAERIYHLAVPLEDGTVFFFGGTADGPTASVYSPCEAIGSLRCPN